MGPKFRTSDGKGIDVAYRCIVEAGVQVVIALPDSQLSPLCQRIREGCDIEYIQAVHESTCVGIATGLSLTGTLAMVIMENSGLRNACETIARCHLSHGLFACYLISHRGAYGERNWWGQAHHTTMEPLLDLLRFRWTYVKSLSEFALALKQAFSTLAAGQSSVALIAEPDFIEDMSR